MLVLELSCEFILLVVWMMEDFEAALFACIASSEESPFAWLPKFSFLIVILYLICVFTILTLSRSIGDQKKCFCRGENRPERKCVIEFCVN